jgi:hypothetical protein
MMLSDPAADYVGLARLACDVGEDAPQAPICASILALMDRMEEFVAHLKGPGRAPGAQGPPPFPGVGLAIVAATLAMTPDVPLPPVPEPVEVAERTP